MPEHQGNSQKAFELFVARFDHFRSYLSSDHFRRLIRVGNQAVQDVVVDWILTTSSDARLLIFVFQNVPHRRQETWDRISQISVDIFQYLELISILDPENQVDVRLINQIEDVLSARAQVPIEELEALFTHSGQRALKLFDRLFEKLKFTVESLIYMLHQSRCLRTSRRAWQRLWLRRDTLSHHHTLELTRLDLVCNSSRAPEFSKWGRRCVEAANYLIDNHEATLTADQLMRIGGNLLSYDHVRSEYGHETRCLFYRRDEIVLKMKDCRRQHLLTIAATGQEAVALEALALLLQHPITKQELETIIHYRSAESKIYQYVDCLIRDPDGVIQAFEEMVRYCEESRDQDGDQDEFEREAFERPLGLEGLSGPSIRVADYTPGPNEL